MSKIVHRTFIFLAIVLIAGGLVGVALFVQGRADRVPVSVGLDASYVRIPAGWKLYQHNDEDFGISFIYPEAWKLKVSSTSPQWTVSVTGDGYLIGITNYGHGGSSETSQRRYYLGGYVVPRVFESVKSGVQTRTFVMDDAFNGNRTKDVLVVTVQNPVGFSEKIDQALSSFRFFK